MYPLGIRSWKSTGGTGGLCATTESTKSNPGSSALTCAPSLIIRQARHPAPCSRCRSANASLVVNRPSSALLESSTGRLPTQSRSALAAGERWSAHASTSSMCRQWRRLSHIRVTSGSGRARASADADMIS
eukprot:scaffold5941_cov125-Isochrysis_galbana.AAC.10